jgi:cytochrome c oxidase assembly factor 6
MGLFSSSTPDRATQVRSGKVFPTRAERLQCWASRDAYFACLDANGISDANADPAATRRACPAEDEAFSRDCAEKWVSYFKEWRVVELKKRAKIEQLEREGAVRMDVKPEFGARK